MGIPSPYNFKSKMEIDERKLKRRLDEKGKPTQNKWDAAAWRLSQSCMKAYVQCRDGRLCPIVFKEYCLKFNIYSESGEAAKKGQYFEWLATGSKPAYGDPVPEPEVYAKGGTAPSDGRQYFAGDTKPDWLLPIAQAQNFHKALESMGMRIIARGVKFGHHGAHGNFDVIIQIDENRWDEHVNTYLQQDIFSIVPRIDPDGPAWKDCKWKDEFGQVHLGCIIIDLKYSALMEDKWSDMGWNLDRLAEKSDTMLQAKHYHWLSGGLPFFFWVFSSKEEDSKIIRILFDSQVVESHTKEVARAVRDIKSEMQQDSLEHPAFMILKDGSKYIPTLKECHACPLNAECLHKAKGPRIYAVHAMV